MCMVQYHVGGYFVSANICEMLDTPKSLELINFCGSNWG